MMARAAGLPCGICGETDPPVDQVHHTIPISWKSGNPVRHGHLATSPRGVQQQTAGQTNLNHEFKGRIKHVAEVVTCNTYIARLFQGATR